MDLGYSFIISASIKQVKGLGLILKCAICILKLFLWTTSCGQRSSPYKRNRRLLGFKNKTDPSEREHVYNQEKTSPEQNRGFTTSCKHARLDLYQNDGKKKVRRRLGAAHDQHHGGAVCAGAWLPAALGYCGSLKMWQKQKLIGKHFIVQKDNDPKHTAKAIQDFLKLNKWNILQRSSQSPDFNPIELHFTRWRPN